MLELEKKGLKEMGRKKGLTEKEFKKLLIKASQPLPKQGQKPDSTSEKTSESQTSGDCLAKSSIYLTKTKAIFIEIRLEIFWGYSMIDTIDTTLDQRPETLDSVHVGKSAFGFGSCFKGGFPALMRKRSIIRAVKSAGIIDWRTLRCALLRALVK